MIRGAREIALGEQSHLAEQGHAAHCRVYDLTWVRLERPAQVASQKMKILMLGCVLCDVACACSLQRHLSPRDFHNESQIGGFSGMRDPMPKADDTFVSQFQTMEREQYP